MPDAPMVSHGRGGQGNIGADATPYVDAGIVRKGPEGDQGDGAYSAGRGGAGNIGSPHVRPKSIQAHDEEVVPDMAIRPSQDGDHHTGRGGQGNFERVKSGEAKPAPPLLAEKGESKSSPLATPQGLADKLKDKIFGHK